MSLEMALYDYLSDKTIYFDLTLEPIRFVERSERKGKPENFNSRLKHRENAPGAFRPIHKLIAVHFVQKGWENFDFRIIISDKKNTLFNSSFAYRSPTIIRGIGRRKACNLREAVEFLSNSEFVSIKSFPPALWKSFFYLDKTEGIQTYARIFENKPHYFPTVFLSPSLNAYLNISQKRFARAVIGLRDDIRKMVGLTESKKYDCLVDCGTGCGALVVPLAILQPGKKFIAVEIDKAKTERLEKIAKALCLENLRIINSRVGALDPAEIGKAYLVTGIETPTRALSEAVEIFSGAGADFLFCRRHWGPNERIGRKEKIELVTWQ